MKSDNSIRRYSCDLLLLKMLTGMLLLSLAVTVHAVPITGMIGFGGNFTAVDENWNSTGTANATGIDFDPNQLIVNNATGSFTGASGVGSTITDFQFDPTLGINDGFNGVTSVTSILDFWTVDSFSFELTSVIKGNTSDPNRFLVLEGTGIISSTGFEDTFGTWAFTGDTVSGSGTFTWSGGTAAVPLPATAWIFITGLGLIGFKQQMSRYL
jgi:hypothetical protein